MSVFLKKANLILFLVLAALIACDSKAQTSSPETNYTFKKGDPNGIGKWYLGREIAHVMGFQGMSWLERPEREQEENTSTLLSNMEIKPENIIADIGAGSGYHVLKMSPLASKGIIYAVDLQQEMLDALRQKKEKQSIDNVEMIKGSEKSANLAENSVDKVLMVDVYHEFEYPIEMIASIKKALKPGGQIYLIEYRAEDDNVPIKKLHKMSEAQAIKEMNEEGMILEKNIGKITLKHFIVFVEQ